MNPSHLIHAALDQGRGILRLTPTWVPRSFCVPGRRIKLHPNDYYALGGQRGGIDERWFASTTPADNGPLTSPHEGLSFAAFQDGSELRQFLLRDAVAELKGALLGERLWKAAGKWPMFSKFFDNQGALPHHIHHRDEHAAKVGQMGKPEAYYFPPQANNHGGDFPFTFFGFEPGTTKDQVRDCLKRFTQGDNQITSLSKAYRLDPGTGWDIPPGILHAPGSLCTYEPQRAADVYAMYQSVVGKQVVPAELLWKDTPADMAADGYQENWICYKNLAYSAKELTVLPGRTAVIRDAEAYGLIMMQGHGKLGVWDIETPTLIRYGQLTHDEFFVSAAAARAGVTIVNPSPSDPIVMLKHFGPDNPDNPHAKA